MTEDRCMDAEALAAHRDWPEGDARRAHLESCGRCRALLASLERFEAEPADLPPGQLAEARERLARARRDWPAAGAAASAEADLGPATAPATTPRRAARPRAAGWPGPWGWTGWRPAMAAAALVVVAASAWWAGRGLLAERPGVVLRAGEAPGAPGARPALVTLAPSPGADGPLLRWHTLPGADAYEVVLLDGSLAEIARGPAGRDTTLALAELERFAGPAAGDAAYWQVIARRAGDALAESAPVPLERAR